jgi:hypothetical protein
MISVLQHSPITNNCQLQPKPHFGVVSHSPPPDTKTTCITVTTRDAGTVYIWNNWVSLDFDRSWYLFWENRRQFYKAQTELETIEPKTAARYHQYVTNLDRKMDGIIAKVHRKNNK